MKPDTLTPSLLNIQKVIKLTEQNLIDEFKKYLLDIDAEMAHQLVNSISSNIEVHESLGELSKKIYGSDSKRNKQSLSQLSLQTFRFTYFITQNYPFHLHHNLSKIQDLINEGKPTEANLIADMMIDLCEKTCDYILLQKLYQFKSAQAHINRKFNEQLYYIAANQKVLAYEQTLNDLNFNLRYHFNISEKNDSKLPYLADYFSYYKSYFNHDSPVVVRLAKYAVIFITYYYQIEAFNSSEIQDIIDSFDDDSQKNAFVYSPFLEDLSKQIYFFQLNQPLLDADSKTVKNYFKRLNTLSKHQLYWNSYINIPELYATVAKTTALLNRYQNLCFRPDFQQFLHEDDKLQIGAMKQFCQTHLEKFSKHEKFQTDQIHLTIVCSALSLLGSEKDKLSCIKQLEMIMITYQQMSFSMSIDTIMALLMSAYFSLKKYDNCVTTYRRFQKLAKGRVINKQNEVTIHIYYYFAQWIIANRPKYLNMLEDLIVSVRENKYLNFNIDLIKSVSTYHKVPIYLN